MIVDYTLVIEDLNNYLKTLTDGNSKYYVSDKRANELVDELENAILSLGNNYKNGTQVCPYPGLGQEMGADGYASIRNLRLLKYKKWFIVFMVFSKRDLLSITKLVHEGYPLGQPIKLKKEDCLTYYFEGKQAKDPLKECLEWMVKLGCFKQYQIESLRERGLL